MSALLRRQTNLRDTEISPFQHRYLIKRPTIKDYIPESRTISLQNTRSRNGNANANDTGASEADYTVNPETADGIDNPMVEKRRFELFIDLIWVGIIGNLAEHYSHQAFTSETKFSVGDALGEFIILFLIAIRMWKNLQEFMTKYHTNDFVERGFLVWYLILAMIYGNNAPFLLDTDHPTTVPIVVYLLSKVSILLIEAVYSLFLPVQRKGILIRLLLIGWPTTAFFVTACFYNDRLQVTLLSLGIVLEFLMVALIDTPIFERWLREERARPWDADHWVERIQDFFIIILGEGVLNLIRGSPLGSGITRRAGTGVLALLLYYMLSSTFFNGDRSRKYVHAVRRTYWRKTMYMFFHTTIFFSTLTLGVSMLFLIEHPNNNAVKPELTPELTERETSESETGKDPLEMARELARFTHNAKWSVSISLAFTFIGLTIIALLSRSLDEPKTLMITNRYIRLAPRALLIAIALCLPIDREMPGVNFLGILAGCLLLLRLWELTVSLERSGGVIER